MTSLTASFSRADIIRVSVMSFPFSGKFFDEAKLVIKLQDENDNSPAFQSKEYPLSVSEDIEVGEQLVQLC